MKLIKTVLIFCGVSILFNVVISSESSSSTSSKSKMKMQSMTKLLQDYQTFNRRAEKYDKSN